MKSHGPKADQHALEKRLALSFSKVSRLAANLAGKTDRDPGFPRLPATLCLLTVLGRQFTA
jgi:hypothetical protein